MVGSGNIAGRATVIVGRIFTSDPRDILDNPSAENLADPHFEEIVNSMSPATLRLTTILTGLRTDRRSHLGQTVTGTPRSTLWTQTAQTRHALPATLCLTPTLPGPQQLRNPCLIPQKYIVVSTQTDPSYCQIHCQFINLAELRKMNYCPKYLC